MCLSIILILIITFIADLKFTSEVRKLIQQWDDSPGILTFMGHTVIPGAMFCPGSDLKAILKAGRGSKYLREFYHGVCILLVTFILKKWKKKNNFFRYYYKNNSFLFVPLSLFFYSSRYFSTSPLFFNFLFLSHKQRHLGLRDQLNKEARLHGSWWCHFWKRKCIFSWSVYNHYYAYCSCCSRCFDWFLPWWWHCISYFLKFILFNFILLL